MKYKAKVEIEIDGSFFMFQSKRKLDFLRTDPHYSYI